MKPTPYQVLAMVSLPVLETLEETDGNALGGIPSSYAWLALQGLGASLDYYHSWLETMQTMKALTIRRNLLMKGPKFEYHLECFKLAYAEFKRIKAAKLEAVKA